jgi:hypothetical protein
MIRRVTPQGGIADCRVWEKRSKRTSTLTLLALTLFGSSLCLASTRVGNTKPLILQSSEAVLSQLPPVADETPAPRRAEFLSQVASPVTQQSTQVSMGKALLSQLPPVAEETPARVERSFCHKRRPR